MIAVRRGLAVLAGMLAVAACGGSEGALSREQFAREANEICVRANEKVRMLGPEPPILTAEKADWILELTKIDRAALEGMRALEPPKGERRAMASMLSSFARGLGKGGEIARASRAGDDAAFRRNVDAPLDALAQAQTSADRYGLVECARLGRVVR
jgi:predicted Zn-dependent protease